MASKAHYFDEVNLPSDLDEYVGQFLAVKLEASSNTRDTWARVIKHFFEWFHGDFGSMTFKDAIQYANYLRGKDFCLEDKKFHVRAMQKFYDKYQVEILNRFDRNPFEAINSEFFGKKKSAKKSTRQIENEGKKAVYDLAEMKDLVKRVREISRGATTKQYLKKALYPLVLLQIFADPRSSENLTIDVKNVHLEDRHIVSGLIKDMNKTGRVDLFFPEAVANELRVYMLRNKVHSGWLFPGIGKNGHLGRNSLIDNLHKLGFRSHHFRHTLCTKLRKAKIGVGDIETITNHAHSGTVERCYVKEDPDDPEVIRARRDLYDESLPQIYRELAAWLDTL